MTGARGVFPLRGAVRDLSCRVGLNFEGELSG